MLDAEQALALLPRMPGGPAVRAALERFPQAALVGGAVRDLLRGILPQECDLVVDGDPAPVVAALGEVVARHERFGTCTVLLDGRPCDIARARTETYATPGALPDVEPAGLVDDLRRRDFTVNAIALAPGNGLTAVPGALEDLRDRRLRVLHERSFRDDPTRLWRLVRYAVRLGFLPDPETDALAHGAVRDGALETVSAERRTGELRLALAEPDPLAALHAAQQLGLVDGLVFDPAATAQALALLGDRGSAALTVLGSCLRAPGWGADFAFQAAERRILDRCAALPALEPVPPQAPSAIDRLLQGEPVEAVCVAGGRGAGETALRWLGDWSRRAPVIDGEDLIAAGVAPGPAVGTALAAVRAAVLDGQVGPEDRDGQLGFALEAIAGEGA